jgi:hypothetical protein
LANECERGLSLIKQKQLLEERAHCIDNKAKYTRHCSEIPSALREEGLFP